MQSSTHLTASGAAALGAMRFVDRSGIYPASHERAARVTAAITLLAVVGERDAARMLAHDPTFVLHPGELSRSSVVSVEHRVLDFKRLRTRDERHFETQLWPNLGAMIPDAHIAEMRDLIRTEGAALTDDAVTVRYAEMTCAGVSQFMRDVARLPGLQGDTSTARILKSGARYVLATAFSDTWSDHDKAALRASYTVTSYR